MASSTPSDSKQSNQKTTLATLPAMPRTMLEALDKAGVNIAEVNVPHVAHYVKVDWEDLCSMDTRDPRTKASPILTVVRVDPQPNAEQRYPGYRGMVLVEFVTEFGDEQYVTHAMEYAETGEKLPLSAWLTQQQAPFICRFGRIETSKREQFIIRQLPWDIEVS